MLWKLLDRALRISLGMLFEQGVFLFERFFRHLTYVIFVNVEVRGGVRRFFF